MPLLHKKPFFRKKPQSGLQPSDKVFFCETTQEVFTDYDEFWERLVLLNALVWSCELTGKPNLTYQEAIESEKKAKKSISSISPALKFPFLHISTHTRRGRINDVSDDIFSYIRDRYFAGEQVEAIVGKHWYDCKVLRVIMPTEQQIEEYRRSLEDSDDEISEVPPVNMVNGNHNAESDDDLIVVRDDHSPVKNDPLMTSQVNTSKPSEPEVIEVEDHPPFASVRYEVIEIEPWDYKVCKKHIVKWDQIRRPKSDFTREKCKMFTKQSLQLGLHGYYVLKDNSECNKARNMKYSDIFVGDTPKLPVTPMKRMFTSSPATEKKKSNSPAAEKKKTQSPSMEKKDKKIHNNNNKIQKSNEEKKKMKPKTDEQKKKLFEVKKDNENKNKDDMKMKKMKPVLSEQEKENIRKLEMEMKMKAQQEFRERLEKMRIERMWKKDLEKEERRLLRPHEYEWRQKKEDLELDHKDLPASQPFQSRIPLNYFADFLMALDFVNTFTESLELDDVYPNGITFEMLENALVVNEVTGVFNDIIQLLLGAVFSLQQEEDEEVEGDTTQDMASMKFEENLESKCQTAAINIANQATIWSQQYQGVPLQKAPLDALTMTEILRLHILASGATNVANAVWRHVNRGGYKHTDDPGLQFKLDEPEIIKKLSVSTVFHLTIEEKIKVMNVLISQILTYASVRDTIEEKLEKLREVSHNFRSYKWAAIRKEKEEVQAKKQKLKELQMAQKQNAAGPTEEAAATIAVIEAELLDEEQDQVKEKETRASKKKGKGEPDEKDFVTQIEGLTKDMRQCSLGQDRAFRRYWLFNKIPGLFVEDRIPELGECCEYPTPVTPGVEPKNNKELLKRIKEQALKNVRMMKREKELEKSSSDKENENDGGAKKPQLTPVAEKKFLKSPNVNVTPTPNSGSNTAPPNSTPNSLLNSPAEEEIEIVDYVPLPPCPIVIQENMEELHSKIFGLCSSDPTTCPAHSWSHSRPRWSCYNTTEQLDKLIESLNSRGLRESELKNNLIVNRDKICKSFEEMESFVFDYTDKEETPNDIKKALKRNLNFPSETPIARVFEFTLRDMILEMEEKMDNGMLGRLKVPDRDSWRQALVDGESLSIVNVQELDWAGKRRIKSSFGVESNKEDNEGLDQLFTEDGVTEANVLKELAVAILLVAQALGTKYMKGPLLESNKLCRKRERMETRMKKRKKQSNAKTGGSDESSSDEEEISTLIEQPNKVLNVLRTPFERWEKSLMACTSMSQLFLHLSTLDDSITWSRSAALKRRCRVCKRSSDYENMLLCDECDGGFHMSCLKPKLTKVPEGDWFCDHCKPKLKPKSPRKQRRSIYSEDQDEEDKDENEKSEDDEEEEVDDEDDEDKEIVNQEYCSACEMGGELVCCDTCPKSFHLDCADLRKIPRGVWSCPLCKEEKQNTSKSSPKSNSRRSKKKLKNDEEIEATLKNCKGSYEQDEEYSPDRSRNRRSAANAAATKRSLEDLLVADGQEYHGDTVEQMIHLLMSHNDSKPFRKPIFRQDNPDYYAKVKKPIDLRTIKTRFNKNKYTTDSEFIADVLLIFQNTQQYFKEGTPEYTSGLKLSKYFIAKVKSSNLESTAQAEGNSKSKRTRRS